MGNGAAGPKGGCGNDSRGMAGRRSDGLGQHPFDDRMAVGDHDGTAAINLTTSHEANSLLGYQEGNPCAKWTWVIGQEQINICTLDRWCQDEGIDPGRVDLLKLDVQGAELKALYGARKLLETTRLVFLEVSFPDNQFANTVAATFSDDDTCLIEVDLSTKSR